MSLPKGESSLQPKSLLPSLLKLVGPKQLPLPAVEPNFEGYVPISPEALPYRTF
jgi:hypothetical protein